MCCGAGGSMEVRSGGGFCFCFFEPPTSYSPPTTPLTPLISEGAAGQRAAAAATCHIVNFYKTKTKNKTANWLHHGVHGHARCTTSQINTHTQRTTLAPQKKTVHIHAPAQPTVTTSRSAAVLPCGRPRAASGEAVLSERRLHPGGRYPGGHVDLGLCLLDQLARLVRSPRRPA